MKGYYHDQEATDETFENGWLLTGDIAKIDDEGFVYIIDRKKEIIVTNRVREIYTERIEEFNKTLSPYETIKKFVLFPRDLRKQRREKSDGCAG